MSEFLRPLIFVCSFAFFALLEAFRPRRARIYSRWKRWPSNLLLVALNNLVIRLLPWFLPVQVAALVQQEGWGVLNVVSLPIWFEYFFAILILDLIIYWQHRLFHRIPLLRSIHRLHHIERDLDVTSALKFHPIEIIISLFIKSVSVLIFGLSKGQIILFEIILNTMAMFNHMNFRIPEAVDFWIRKVFVTPDMHRIHHSINPKEADTNFGFNLSLWDYLFKSYLKEAEKGQREMILGHAAFLQDKYTALSRQLLIPFK